METRYSRPRSNLPFSKPQAKSTGPSSSLSRKNEALEKYKEENNKLKDEIKRLKYTIFSVFRYKLFQIELQNRIKTSCNDASTGTTHVPCIRSDVSVQTSLVGVCVDAVTETDVCDCDDVSDGLGLLMPCFVLNVDASVQTNLAATSDAFTETDVCDGGSVPTKTNLAPRFGLNEANISLEVNSIDAATETNFSGVFTQSEVAASVNIHEFGDSANSTDAFSFNYPHLALPEIKLLHSMLNDEDFFANLVSRYNCSSAFENFVC